MPPPAPSQNHRPGNAAGTATTLRDSPLPEGYGTLVPASGGGKEVWISLSWIVFTLVAVGARHWIGAVSAIWLLTLSAISGGRLLADSYLAWGLWLMASSLVGLMALALALRAGGFSRKRRSADGR